MDKRIALIGIILDDPSSVDKLNAILHDYATLIIGRMGLPLRDRGISIISVVAEGTLSDISSLSGKLGRLSGVSVKVSYAKS